MAAAAAEEDSAALAVIPVVDLGPFLKPDATEEERYEWPVALDCLHTFCGSLGSFCTTARVT